MWPSSIPTGGYHETVILEVAHCSGGVRVSGGRAVAGALAAQTGQLELIARLEARAQQLERATEGTKGAHAALLGMQRVRVKKLIERIKAGENVDPQEIDIVLRKDVHSVR